MNAPPAYYEPRYLHPALDITAAGHREHFLIANSTPQTDCLADLIRCEVAQHDPDLARRMLTLVSEIARLNRSQVESARRIAGNFESDIAGRKDRQQLSKREAVRVLRPLLANAQNPLIPDAPVQLRECVQSIVSSGQGWLLKDRTVLRELGAGKAGLLASTMAALSHQPEATPAEPSTGHADPRVLTSPRSALGSSDPASGGRGADLLITEGAAA